MSTTISFVQQDLERTKAEWRKWIADELDIGLDTVSALPQTSELKLLVEAALQPLGRLTPDELRKLARFRIFFETLMAIDVASDDEKRGAAEATLRPINEELRTLSKFPGLAPRDFSESWDIDGEFHRKLCECSEHKHLTEVVDSVIRVCKPLGTPRNRDDLIATVREHDTILESIAVGPTSAEVILDAVRQHVGNAQARWFTKEGEGMVTDDVEALVDELIGQLRERYGDRVADLEGPLASALRETGRLEGDEFWGVAAERLCEDLAIQHLYPGEHVVFLDDVATVDGNDRFVRTVLYHSRHLDEAFEFVSSLNEKERPHVEIEFQPPASASLMSRRRVVA